MGVHLVHLVHLVRRTMAGAALIGRVRSRQQSLGPRTRPGVTRRHLHLTATTTSHGDDKSANVRFRPSRHLLQRRADDGGGVWSPPSSGRPCADDGAVGGEARSLAVEERRGSPPKCCPLPAAGAPNGRATAAAPGHCSALQSIESQCVRGQLRAIWAWGSQIE